MPSHSYMEINGLKCQVNLPDAPEGEGTHKLPPGRRIPVFDVEDYPACPSNWMHGGEKAASYFFAVEPGKHLWLDFNMNAQHTHDIAIVMSIQGVNPVTGPINQDSKKLEMKQYKVGDPCPIHGFDEDGSELTDGEELGPGLFCEKCGFKWPTQNYMTTTSCPDRLFWIDGWRADGDSIRGFLITAETMKGIAAQTIGDERVWAIGIAFFLSKEPKPAPPPAPRITRNAAAGYDDQLLGSSMDCDMSFGGGMTKGGPVASSYSLEAASSGGTKGLSSTRKAMRSRSTSGLGGTEARRVASRGGPSGQSARHEEPVREVETEKLEIGGGAKINQNLNYPDPKSLDHYEDAPFGVLYGNYCTVDDFDTIVRAGVKDRTAGGEGFMSGLETGNP